METEDLEVDSFHVSRAVFCQVLAYQSEGLGLKGHYPFVASPQLFPSLPANSPLTGSQHIKIASVFTVKLLVTAQPSQQYPDSSLHSRLLRATSVLAVTWLETQTPGPPQPY